MILAPHHIHEMSLPAYKVILGWSWLDMLAFPLFCVGLIGLWVAVTAIHRHFDHKPKF